MRFQFHPTPLKLSLQLSDQAPKSGRFADKQSRMKFYLRIQLLSLLNNSISVLTIAATSETEHESTFN